MTLADERCVPCRKGDAALSAAEAAGLLTQLSSGWTLSDDRRLEREFTFPDFASALNFVNTIGTIAEEQGHHPDLYLAWGKVRVTIWTHVINGLSRADFVLAAKIG